ncbi:XRE family transcriptional regulator [Clostridium sp. KNHs216]|uniref:LexA family protein n=1 Tax=Clostridium sp. KNHs216 TaxID=1550235 RepID=UPI001151226D|nr:XRE family transcriptional regulator [Clostridium sp. KNHs216]TQI66756.1 repressor LexA [Clostridium sp. KNHs216]
MEQLKTLRKQKKISQKKLAEDLHVTQATVSRWETGDMLPTIDILNEIADYFGVSVDYLLGKSDIPTADTRKIGVKIPVLGYVRAGIPIDAIEEILDYEEIPKSMADQGEYFGLQIKGDSMEPRMQEGDVVIVRKQSDVESGDIAVVLVNGNDATVKKFVKHENGVSLVASNPKYDPMFYTFAEVESKPICVIGKVVELRAKY